ncbi:MAG: hypothetical protein U1F40_03880 [Turneriella sp.]
MRAAFLVAILPICGSLACSSQNLKSADTDDLNLPTGEKVGTVRRINPNEQEYIYDRNQDGQPENRWIIENSQIKVFEKFDSKTGNLRTRSYYFRGILNRIEVFAPDGSIRGVVNYPDGVNGRSVDLPKKKKLVEFIDR